MRTISCYPVHSTVRLQCSMPIPRLAWCGADAIEYRNNNPLPVVAPNSGKADADVLDSAALIQTLAVSNLYPSATVVVRTSVQKRLGGYLPELPHAGDLEMWVRFALYSKVAQVKTMQAVYRRHGSNMSLGYRGFLEFRAMQKGVQNALSRNWRSSAHGAALELLDTSALCVFGCRVGQISLEAR